MSKIKNLLLLFWLLLPGFAGATVALPIDQQGRTLAIEQADIKQGFLKRATQKILLQHFKS